MPSSEETCVVTVTYGDRYNNVRELVMAAARNGVGQIVIVDNGSFDSSRQQLQHLAQQTPDVTLLPLAENRGSAVGFATGLRYVFEETHYPYIWCLDDDNIPASGALQALLDVDAELRDDYPHGSVCLVSLREDQPWLLRVAHGESPSRVFLRRSSFCGFHIADAVRLGWMRMARRQPCPRELTDQPIPLRFAPYGGLWIPTRMIGEVGYPDERLVLYHDDTEFTSRLVRQGAHLLLVPTSQIRDAELSWAQVQPYEDGFSRVLLSNEELRIYYNTRNKVYFEIHGRENSKILQKVNELVFWCLLHILSVLYQVPERRRLVRKAVLDGKRGVLGQNDAFPLTG